MRNPKLIAGDNIRHLRNGNGWDQNNLASKLTKAGIRTAQTTVSSWERFGFPLKKKKLLNKVAEILGTTPEWLITNHKANESSLIIGEDIIEIKELLYEILKAVGGEDRLKERGQ